MGAIVDFNVAFDQGCIYKANEQVILKEQFDSGRFPEFIPFLYLTVDSEKYGRQEISVSKRVYEKYNEGDFVPLYVSEGAIAYCIYVYRTITGSVNIS